MSTITAPRSDLAVRTAAGVAMAAVALVAVWLGDVLFWLLIVVAALLMLSEWADLDRAGPVAKRQAQFALFVPLALTAPTWILGQSRPFFVLGLIVGAFFYTVIVTRRRDLAVGAIYCGVPVLALTLLRRQHAPDTPVTTLGLIWTLWTLAIVWATDIGAYFAGRAIGGPKLAPRLSPAKTWAGLGGGVLAASLVGAAFFQWEELPKRLALATPVLAVLAQGGDLFESWLKRRAGVKDSGTILPGHGGVLDRLDGLVPVAPAAAFLAVVVPLLYRR